MKFDTKDAVNKHQKKFCSQSDYGNIAALEKKMHSLGHDPLNQDPKLGLKDIKSYLRGEDPSGAIPGHQLGDLRLNELKDHFDQKSKVQESKDAYDRTMKGKDLYDDVKALKNKKHLMRLQKGDEDEEVLGLMKELEQRKEKDLRAEIEKEEIARTMKELDKNSLTNADKLKRRELEKLSAERENLRIREQNMMDDIGKMEQEMIEKEKGFRREADHVRKSTNSDPFAINEIKKKELEMAKERGSKVVELKHKREQLEAERQNILNSLDNIQSGANPYDRPRSMAGAGQNIMQSVKDIERQDIDPALKDKLISDQVRINHLREQQMQTKGEMMNMDQLDLLTDQMNHSMPIKQPAPNLRQTQPPSYQTKTAGAAQFKQQDNSLFKDIGAAPYNQVNDPQQEPEELPMKDDIQQMRIDYVNNGGNDPEFLKRLQDLDDFVNNRAPDTAPKKREAKEIHVHEGAPQFGAPIPGGMPGMIPPMGGAPFGGPMGGPIGGMPPPYGVPPVPQYAMPPPMAAPGPLPHPPQNVPAQPNPQLKYMQDMIEREEEENKKLQDEISKMKEDEGSFNNMAGRAQNDIDALKGVILPGVGGAGGDRPFPEDFVFRQNEFRSEDLEVEERALMNICTQEYDHLRLISRLPVNSELYRYKMDQFKEISTMRSEVEKVLQEQRLEKLRRDFEKQKYEDERRYNHERWLEEQKREILAAKLKMQAEGGRQPNTQQVPQTQQQYPDNYPQSQNQFPVPQQYPAAPQQYPPPTQNTGQPQIPQTATRFPPHTAKPRTQNQVNTLGNEPIYDAQTGFMAFFDCLSRVPRQHKAAQIVYGCFNHGKPVSDSRIVPQSDAEPDPESPAENRVVYDVGHNLKHIQPHPSSNMIIEVQVIDPEAGPSDPKHKSYGWTVLNLYDYTYAFHSGEFKLPLYVGKTLADQDTRDINRLEPLPDSFLCMRLALPLSDIATSQYLPDKSSNEYRIPSIHDVDYIPPAIEQNNMMGQPQAQPGQPNQVKPQNGVQPEQPGHPTNKDPFYKCSGVNVFVHYVNRYPSQNRIRVGCTLLEEAQVVRIGYDQRECNWSTNPVDASKALIARWKSENNAQPDGAPIIDRAKHESDQDVIGMRKKDYDSKDEDILIPIDNEVTWEHDFYKLQWDKNLMNDLFLVTTLLEQSTGLNDRLRPSNHGYTTTAYGTVKVNNPDGTIRYGTYDIPLYHPPPKTRNHDPDKKMKSTIKVTISQPMPSIPQNLQPPMRDNQQPLPNQPQQNGNQNLPIDNQFNPPINRAPSDAPFVPNDQPQTVGDPFGKADGIYFYVDGARFLPENVSYTRMTLRMFTKSGKIVNPADIGKPDLDISHTREPFFGIRAEVFPAKTDPTSYALMTIDSNDLSSGEPRIVGHAVFPLFLKEDTKAPCNSPSDTNFILNNGNFQIPIFYSVPKQKDLSFEMWQNIEKIPCATLLVRVRKALTQANGKPYILKNLDFEEANQLGVVEPPPPYRDGVYNTTYCPTTNIEDIIYQQKSLRNDPALKELITTLFLEAAGQNKNMTNEQIHRWCEQNLLKGKAPDVSQFQKLPYIDIRFFSEYIPQLGLTCEVEILHNVPNKSLYYVILSTAPPGSLYTNDSEGVTSDVKYEYEFDFDSPLKAIKFKGTKHKFDINTPKPYYCLVAEIFEVKMRGEKISTVKNYGFSIVPLFQNVETDADAGTMEMYVNTGIYQLPVIKNTPASDFIERIPRNDDVMGYINKHIQKRNLEIIPKVNLILNISDGQLPDYQKDLQTKWQRLDPNYLPKNKLKQYLFRYTKDYMGNKTNMLKNQLPKKMEQPAYFTQAYDDIVKRFKQ